VARLTRASTPGTWFSTRSRRVEQAAQVMPEMARSRVWTGTEKPVFLTCSAMAAGSARAGSNSTRAFSVARLTLALTPSSRFRFFSRRVEQAAQVMPETGSSMTWRVGCGVMG
jgi:hypothetical protein